MWATHAEKARQRQRQRLPACWCCCASVQVLSPATILAVDRAALTLLDLPCLVAVILGVLADEFGWIAKSFPQAFSVSVADSGQFPQAFHGLSQHMRNKPLLRAAGVGCQQC